jgi:hypothetical protein
MRPAPQAHVAAASCIVINTFLAAGVVAQDATRIPDAPTCPACSITLTPTMKIAVQEGPGAVAEPKHVIRDSAGRFYVTSAYFEGEIKVYGPDGGYVGHLAKAGSGPGEMAMAAVLVRLPNDTVHAFDTRNIRHTVFSPDRSVARESRNVLPISEAVAIDADHILVAAPFEQSQLWFTLHIVTSAGRVVRSFGEPVGPFNPAIAAFSLRRRIAIDRRGTIWAAESNGDYRFQAWLPDGLVRTYERVAPWYAPSGERAMLEWRPGQTTPPAYIVAIRMDEQDRLWVISHVARADWRETYARKPLQEFRVFDSVLEVIDPIRGTVVARTRWPRYILGFVGPDLYSYDEDQGAYPRITVWAPSIPRMQR